MNLALTPAHPARKSLIAQLKAARHPVYCTSPGEPPVKWRRPNVWPAFTQVPIPSIASAVNFFVFSQPQLADGLHTNPPMDLRIFAITRQGLVALALAVTALWTCVGMEVKTRRQADRDMTASIRTLARLRHLTVQPDISTPARSPMPSYLPQRPYSS